VDPESVDVTSMQKAVPLGTEVFTGTVVWLGRPDTEVPDEMMTVGGGGLHPAAPCL
jgi:hypothetical protein